MSDGKLSIISKETLVPLGSIVLLVGGIWWLTALYFDVQVMKATMARIELSYTKVSEENRNGINRITILETQYQAIITSLAKIEKAVADK